MRGHDSLVPVIFLQEVDDIGFRKHFTFYVPFLHYIKMHKLTCIYLQITIE